MKLAVIYDSRSNNTASCAEAIARGMQTVEGTEARIFHIDDFDLDYVKECTGIVFGTPTYMAGPSSSMYSWFEKNCQKMDLPGKLGGAFATGNYIHGGEDLAITILLTHMLTKGMMAYSSGNAFGKPFIHVGPVSITPDTDKFLELFETYGYRFATQAKNIIYPIK